MRLICSRPSWRLFLLASVFGLFAGAANAREEKESCLGDLTVGAAAFQPLVAWGDLPAVTGTPLAADLRALIDAHPLYAKLKTRFGSGHGLRFQNDVAASRGGWLIQGLLLEGIIKHVFPGATFVSQCRENCLNLRLEDSTWRVTGNRSAFDMVDLKILNAGPVVPGAEQVRKLLSLPPRARIASVYDAIKTSLDARAIVRSLFDDQLVDIVILSSQTREARHEKFGWHNEVPLFTSAEWVAMEPSMRPARAIIYNDTRNRMPFIHAASDFVIVTGEANIFEPIFVGRPVFFDGKGGNVTRSGSGWKRIGDVAKRSGFGFSIANTADFKAQLLDLETRNGPGVLSPSDRKLALNNVLKALTELTESP